MKFGRRDTVLALVAVALMASTIVLGLFVFQREEKKESDIRVDDVYFLMKGANSERSVIEIVVFISNIGEKDISKLEIRAFTVESGSNLAMDDSNSTIRNVKQQTTVEGNLIVDIPNNETYRMELLIFRDDRLEIRGSGTIDLTGVGGTYDYRINPEYGDDNTAEGSSTTGREASSLLMGVCLFLVAIFAIIGIIVYVVVKMTGRNSGRGEEFFREGPPISGGSGRTEPRLEEFIEGDAKEKDPGRAESPLKERGQESDERSTHGKFAPPLK